MTRRIVKLVATGGTIANTSAGRIPINSLLGDLPEVGVLADIQSIEVMRASSAEFTPDHWIEIARAVDHAARDAETGAVVVTHGTVTAEETAYFLHLTIHSDLPIVLVASQRQHGSVSNDGDRNLLEAVRVATEPTASGKGVLVVLHEEIHSARDVTKSNQRPGGFVSWAGGLLGHIERDRVTLYRAPLRRHTVHSEFDIRAIDRLPRVDIVSAYPGADDVQIRASLNAGTQGIIVHGYAYQGAPTPSQRPALRDAQDAGVPVVLSSRGGAGRIPVGASDHVDATFVKADNLSPQKARVLLMVALTKFTRHADLQRAFDQY